MSKHIRLAFLLLILSQGFHSAEEYFTRLWDVFAPARILSNLVSTNTEKGFIIINIFLFIAGIICWILISMKNGRKFLPLIWFFIVIEFINGIGHPLWGILERQYVPGLASALIVLVINVYLTFQIRNPRIRNAPDMDQRSLT
jgi:hypothetical protein